MFRWEHFIENVHKLCVSFLYVVYGFQGSFNSEEADAIVKEVILTIYIPIFCPSLLTHQHI